MNRDGECSSYLLQYDKPLPQLNGSKHDPLSSLTTLSGGSQLGSPSALCGVGGSHLLQAPRDCNVKKTESRRALWVLAVGRAQLGS